MSANVVIQFRRGTAASWTSANPTLAIGEVGYESDTAKMKVGDGSTAWTSLGYLNTLSAGVLNDISDVTITSAADGDFLRWNGSAWINDAVNLGTDSVGDYVESLTAGTGVTLSNNSGEGATPTIAIGQSVGTTDDVTFNTVTTDAGITVGGNIVPDTDVSYDLGTSSARFRDLYLSGTSIDLGGATISSDGTDISVSGGLITGSGLTGDLTGNADTATSLETARTISLSGDVVGSVSFDGTANVDIAATIQADSVALGTDTTGDYTEGVTAGTGVTVTGGTGEGNTPTIAIGQAVGTTDNVQFNDVTVDGNLTVNGTTTSINTTELTIEDNVVVLNSNATTASVNAGIEVERGTSDSNVLVRWNETLDIWEFTNDGTTYHPVPTTDPSFGQVKITDGLTFETINGGTYDLTFGFETLTADQTITFPNESGMLAIQGTIELGDDTTGDYVQDVTAGTGVTVTDGTGEGSQPTIAIGQPVATTDDVTFNSVTGNLIGDVKSTDGTTVLDSGTDGTDATFTGDVTGNASTASALETSRTIELTGDVTGSVSFDGSANVQISTTVSADSTVLGTDTTGDYVESISGGTGVTITGGTGEGSTPSVAIGQSVGTTDDVTFNSVTGNLVGDVKATNGTTVLDSGTDGTDATFTGDVTGSLTGNADTATALETGRTISLSGDVVGSVSFDGTANVDITATIQENSVALGTDTTGDYVQNLVAGTGITLSSTTGESDTPTVSIGQAVATSDDVTFNTVTLGVAPSQATHAATKSYVDTAVAGLDWHQAAKFATAAALPNSPAYNNGSSGVDATLTAAAYARLSVDGTNATTGDRVLVKNQSTASENGVYVVTEQGNGVDTYWVLTRATDFDASPSSEVKSGEAIYVTAGAVNARQGFVLTTSGSGTDGAHAIGTDDLSFTQFTGTQAFTAGDGMSQSGNTINVGTASTARIVVNADDIDLASFAQSNTSGADTTTFVSSVTVDAYGRVTGQETSAIDFADTPLTGTPTAPTASVGTSTTQVATTAFVDAEIGDQAVLNSVVDAKGDLIVASGADAVARLGVGTDGYFLKANSAAANGVEWATVAETTAVNDLTDAVITSAANGEILQYDGTNWVNAVQAGSEPIGHENKADSTISFNDGTRVFTIEPASSSFTVWCKGKRYVKSSAETVTIGATTGLYYIYFNSSGVLSYRTSYFDWENDTPTAYIYWNATTSKAEFFADERHGVVLDWQTHEYLHRTRGASIASGFGASGYVTNGDGSSDAHHQIAFAGGTFFDEDLQVDIVHAASPTANSWEQVLEGTAEIPVFYMSGSAWVKDTATTSPFKAGTSRAQYNYYNGSTWTTADVENNKYGCMWIVATNNTNEPVIAILGQTAADNQSTVEERDWEDLSLNDFPVFEFRPLYKIAFVVSDGFSNTLKAAIRGVTDIRRAVSAGSGIPGTPVSDHGSMTGLSDDDHTHYLHVTDTRVNVSADITTTGAISASSLGTNSDVVFEGATADDFETTLTAADPTADRTITLPDASGTLAINGTIALGTDTTGNYMSDLSAGTGIAVSHTPAEGSTATVSLSANLDDVSDVTITSATSGDFLKWDGAAWVNDVVDLGTDTNGDYVESLVAGTGVTLSNNSGEGATPTIAIGQSVETTDSPTFAGATLDAIQVGITDANEIDTSSGNLTIDSAGGTVTVDDNLVVSGDLTVNGTTVTVNSTVTTVDDPVITLGGDAAPTTNDSKDRGVEFRWHDGTSAKVGFFGYDDGTGRFTFIPDATNTGEVFTGTLGSVDVDDIYINGTASTGTGGAVRTTDPALAGTPTAPTASVGDSTTQIATTAFVSAEIGDQAILNADIVATGDLIVGASAGTPDILSVGTDGYFLKANSGATNGVEWASIPTINLDDVGDVNTPTPSDGQFLKYVSASSEWQAADIPTINAIDDVGDVNAPSPSDGQFLKYVSASSEWQAADIPTINALDDVGDVNAASPSDGQFLKYVSASSEWQAADIPTINAIDDVGDVAITSVSDNDVLRYDSGTSTWVNDPLTDLASLASPTFTGTVTLPATTLFPESYYNFTASATLTLATHQYKVIEANSSSAITITVPTNANEAFPVGTVITITRVGTGEVTISGDTGVTVNTSVGSRLRAQWSTATIRKRSTDTWLLSGDIKV